MNTIITKEKITEKLEKFLNRKPTKNEVTNGEKDQNIINEIILEKLEELELAIKTK